MLFQTVEFLVLLLVFMGGIALLRGRTSQHWLIVVTSFVFYGWWDVRFLMLLLVSTVIDFSGALGIAGVKLSLAHRLRMSAMLTGATLLFLTVNWPVIQGHAPGPVTPESVLSPSWPGLWAAVSISLGFALLWPLGYEGLYRLPRRARRRAFLALSIGSNLAMLGFFKYCNFFADSLLGLGRALGMDPHLPVLDVALPVGISFYTFQTMSYTIDAYRGAFTPSRSLLRMAAFVAYFPQLVAGPIIRPQEFFPALEEPWRLRGSAVRAGFHLCVVGMVKKVLIADWIAPMVEDIFRDPAGKPSLVVMLGAALFAVQIYCDFSGYTDIARGVSRMFGVHIPLNFNFPYFSTSIADFWRRWHISLSTWLRDYLYIPLGGNRRGIGRTYFNLMATMVLGGLWHGASWNFVVWGAYQGGLLCINRLAERPIERSASLSRFLRSRVGTVVRWAVTMYLVLLGWLIFRVSDPADLWYCARKFVLFDGRLELTNLGLGRGMSVISLLAMGLFVVLHARAFFVGRWSQTLDDMPRPALWLVYVLLGVLFFFGWPPTNAPFIYFQF